MAEKPLTKIVPTLSAFNVITVAAQIQHNGEITSGTVSVKVSCLEELEEYSYSPYQVSIFTIIKEHEITSTFGFGDTSTRDHFYRKVNGAFCEAWVAQQIAALG